MKLTSIIAILAFAFVANANEPAPTAAPAPATKEHKMAAAHKEATAPSGDATTAAPAVAKKGKKVKKH